MIFENLAWTLTALILAAAAVFYASRRDYYRSLGKIPGFSPTVWIGNISWTLGVYATAERMKYHPGIFFTESILGSTVLYRARGMFCQWIFLQPLVCVFEAEIAELVLGSSTSNEKSYEYNFLHKWLGTGLLTSKGRKWRHRRKLLTPSFHFRILEDFLPIFNRQSSVLVETLRSHSNEECVDVAPLVLLCTLDIICETILGVAIGAQKGNNTEYVRAVNNLADLFCQRTARPWMWPDLLFGFTKTGRDFNRDADILHNLTDKIIREKKEKLMSDSRSDTGRCPKRRKAFMDLLLDMHVKGRQLSEQDIREEVDTFMFEGHDTTAMGVIFALYCIGLYPEVQRRLSEELDEIFGGDVHRCVTYDDARRMKYLECVLKESQRLFPSVPVIGRKLGEDVHCGGVKIPKDTTVRFNLLGLHRNPDTFPNPEIFDPERFLPENSLNRHPYAYVPFSAGPRNCVGQKFAVLEEKIIVSNILRHFSVTSLDPRDRFHVKIEITLRPAQEVRLKFSPKI